jgi:hypothetical protein
MMNNKIKAEFIQQIKGKDFVIFAGLLDMAHNEGLNCIDTEVKQFPNDENQNTAVVKAVIKTSKGSFSGIGDANTENVNYMVAAHIIRMAETRAIARALRFACNIGVTAFEELSDAEDIKHPVKTKQDKKKEMNGKIIEQQKKAIIKLLQQIGVKEDNVDSFIKQHYKVGLDELSFEQAGSIIKKLSEEINDRKKNDKS